MTRLLPPISLVNYKWLALPAIAVGTFTSVVDYGSVIVALPSIAEHFGTDLLTTQWIVIVYALTISALLLPMGRLSDILGRKRVYIAGFGIFIVGGFAAGTSTHIVLLIMSKLVQGVGAAMTQGTGMAMIVSAFPGHERGKALGLHMSVVGTGGVAGPAIGGLLVGELGWRWVFFGGMLLAALAIVAAMLVLEGRRSTGEDGSALRFDWPGAALSTGVLVAFLLGLTSGPGLGWSSPLMALALASFVGSLSAFIWWELRTPAPMMDLRLFKIRLFSMGVIAGFIAFLGTSSVRFLMPFYLQAGLGYSPSQVGLIIVPSALTMVVMGPLSGRLSDRYGWTPFNVGGLLVSACGLFLLSTLKVDSPLGLVMAAIILATSGTGIFNAPNNSSILSAVAANRYGVVSGFLNLVRNSANVTGISLATAIVTAVMSSEGYLPTLAAVSYAAESGVIGAFTAGMRMAYVTMGCVVLMGVIASLVKGHRSARSSQSEVEKVRAQHEISD